MTLAKLQDQHQQLPCGFVCLDQMEKCLYLNFCGDTDMPLFDIHCIECARAQTHTHTNDGTSC